jgi:hypothetical protein
MLQVPRPSEVCVHVMVRRGGPHLRGSGVELHRLQRPLPAVPASARLARVTARVACRAWRVPEAGEVAALVASELVATALSHEPKGQLTLRVLMTPRRLRLELHAPTLELPLDLATGHDDLVTVRVLEGTSTRWGVEPHGAGIQLYAEIAL